jgi:hypothetical protein
LGRLVGWGAVDVFRKGPILGRNWERIFKRKGEWVFGMGGWMKFAERQFNEPHASKPNVQPVPVSKQTA